MKADLSTSDIIRIQVVSRLSDLLFDELQKIEVKGAPISIQRIRLSAIENAAAIPASHDRFIARNSRRGYRFARKQLKEKGTPKTNESRTTRTRTRFFGERFKARLFWLQSSLV